MVPPDIWKARCAVKVLLWPRRGGSTNISFDLMPRVACCSPGLCLEKGALCRIKTPLRYSKTERHCELAHRHYHEALFYPRQSRLHRRRCPWPQKQRYEAIRVSQTSPRRLAVHRVARANYTHGLQDCTQIGMSLSVLAVEICPVDFFVVSMSNG